MIEIKTTVLKCFLAHAEKKSGCRPQLQSVKIEPLNGYEAVMVATDGHRMAVLKVDGNIEPVTIPADVLLAACKTAPTKGTIHIYHDRIDCGSTNINFTPVDMEYPDWRRVIPSADTEVLPASYNPAYLVEADRLISALGHSFSPIRQHGDKAGGLIVAGNCIVVVMSIKCDEPESLPAWVAYKENL